MKCGKCGKDIRKANAKFCPHCGEAINTQTAVTKKDAENDKNMSIIAITIVIIAIIIAALCIYCYAPSFFGASSGDTYSSSQPIEKNISENATEVQSSSSSSASQSSSSGSWKSIGEFSGSGSGSKTIKVPAGQIRIDLSAYPIKNYATNHLYVSGSNGKSAGVDWGSTSAVATRSDSLSFTSNTETTFTIEYYETVSWNVEVYKYQ